MESFDGKHEGNIDLDYRLQLNGMVVGDITVENGGYLQLNGMVTESLTVEQGGEVELRGTVSGDVFNNGGNLEILGVVDGRLVHESGETNVDYDAIVAGSVEGL